MERLRYLDKGWRLFDENQNEWEWSNRAGRHHNLGQWREVSLPASVQQSLLVAGEIKHPYHDLNSREAEWIEHRDWIYGLDFELPPRPARERVFLQFEAVDDRCLVYLNQTLLGSHEGPGAPFEFEIGPFLQKQNENGPNLNQLIVIVKAPTPEFPQVGWTDKTRSLKGRMGFGWDFAPRMVRTGIVGRASLRFTGPGRINNLWVRPSLSPDYQRATLSVEALVNGSIVAGDRGGSDNKAIEDTGEGEVFISLQKDGQTVASEVVAVQPGGLARTDLVAENPAIWWPNGLGNQPLYTVRAEYRDRSFQSGQGPDREPWDVAETSVGIREVTWERRPGAPSSEWPFILKVNGRNIFQKGWNWVPADQMGDQAAEARLKPLLELARHSGANILRCWGGADPETPAFYNECDRLGLLVWQEFPLSSSGITNSPPNDPDYLERLAAFAKDVVVARRNHPSLAMWGGGNELTEPGPGNLPLTGESPYAQVLKKVIDQYDPARSFRPSSPFGPQFDADPEKGELWDVHGPWDYSQRQFGPQYWRFNSINPLLHSEFGLPGEASLETQSEYISTPFSHSPVRSGHGQNPARRHHGGAWWDHSEFITKTFGQLESADDFVLASQWLQAEGLRYAIEESRRRWPHTAGVYPWQFNEPWPQAVGTSAVEYTGRVKLAYRAVRQAYSSRLVTARYKGLTVNQGEPLEVEIWILNDPGEKGGSGEVSVSFTDLNGQALAAPSTRPFTGGTGSKLFGLELALPTTFQGVAVLTLALAEGNQSRYLFSNLAEAPLREALAYPELLKNMFEG